MVIYNLPMTSSSYFLENWFYRAMRVFTFSFVGFQFLEEGEDFSPFGIKDSENKTITDYFNVKTDSNKNWFDSASEYITDMVDWSSDEDESVAIKRIIDEEFRDYYQTIVNSDIISVQGETLHGLPPNRYGRTSEEIIILIHIFFKTGISDV